MMRLLAVVIAYNPDYEDLRNNIYSYYYDVEHLIIWNNTPRLSNDECKRLLSLGEDITNVEIMGDGENHLIAYPINRVIEWGLENEFTHILTMDQDSQFVDFNRRYIESLILNIDQWDSNAIFYGANFNKFVDPMLPPHIVPEIITSGTIYNIQKTVAIGGFREDYGIDAVDIEAVYRAKSKGYNTYILPNIELIHQLGDSIKTKLGFTTLNYSAFRYYHIVRNYIRMWQEYPRYFKKKKFFLKTIILFGIPKIILMENDKIKKLTAIFKGIYDGIR